jgi:hypothetical protein
MRMVLRPSLLLLLGLLVACADAATETARLPHAHAVRAVFRRP